MKPDFRDKKIITLTKREVRCIKKGIVFYKSIDSQWYKVCVKLESKVDLQKLVKKQEKELKMLRTLKRVHADQQE